MKEALYTVQFGDVAVPGKFINGGVVVLETNRIFGGDSGYYYLGTYKIKDDVLEASIRVVKHNPDWGNAWGDADGDFQITAKGKITGNSFSGTMQRGPVTLPLRLIWQADLP